MNRRKPRYFGAAKETEYAVDKTSRGVAVRFVTHDGAVENPPGVKAEANPPCVVQWELGKPVPFPGKVSGVRKKQFPMTTVRVKDFGKSECRFVMKRIGVEVFFQGKME